MSGRIEGQEQLSKPIKPQHIEQQMQYPCMQKHVCQERPWLRPKLRHPSRQFQIVQPRSRIPIEKRQEDTNQCGDNKDAYIYIYELQTDVSSIETTLQISNKVAHYSSFFSNIQ